jgi:hypothetical protein
MGSVAIPGQPDSPGEVITVNEPTPINTPGAGVSSSPSVTDELALNDSLYLQEFAQAQKVLNYLLAVSNWKLNGVQQQANGLPVSPPPVPPAGYVPAPAPAPVTAVSAPSTTTIVHAIDQWGQYPAPGDTNPAGTKIPNPYIAGGSLVKVVSPTPFGNSMWYVAV